MIATEGEVLGRRWLFRISECREYWEFVVATPGGDPTVDAMQDPDLSLTGEDWGNRINSRRAKKIIADCCCKVERNLTAPGVEATPLRYVWAVVNEKAFCHSAIRYSTGKRVEFPVLYARREAAEEAVRPFAEKAHQEQLDHVHWLLKVPKERKGFTDEEARFWAAHPPLRLWRRRDRTMFYCGTDPFGDRGIGCSYGWINKMEIAL